MLSGKLTEEDSRVLAKTKTMIHQLYSSLNIEEHQVYVKAFICCFMVLSYCLGTDVILCTAPKVMLGHHEIGRLKACLDLENEKLHVHVTNYIFLLHVPFASRHAAKVLDTHVTIYLWSISLHFTLSLIPSLFIPA